jgi:hypothetical protein
MWTAHIAEQGGRFNEFYIPRGDRIAKSKLSFAVFLKKITQGSKTYSKALGIAAIERDLTEIPGINTLQCRCGRLIAGVKVYNIRHTPSSRGLYLVFKEDNGGFLC